MMDSDNGTDTADKGEGKGGEGTGCRFRSKNRNRGDIDYFKKVHLYTRFFFDFILRFKFLFGYHF